MDGRTLIPDFEEQQKQFLDIMLSLNNSRYFREKFEAGEEEAIFEYAKESKVCLESPWVIDQIEEWRIKNTSESRIKLKKFFKCYLGEERGKTSWDDLKELIKKDQLIFHEILKYKKRFPQKPLRSNREQEGIFELVRKRIEDFGLYHTTDTIELVYNKYKEVADTFIGRRKIYASKIGASTKRLVCRGRGSRGRFKDDMEFIEYFIKTSLDEIFQRSMDNVLAPFGLDFRCSRCEKRIVRKSERKSID